MPMGLLLDDLRDVHEKASGVSLAWEIFAGRAGRRGCGLLALASDGHPQTLRQLRWANAQLKELSPQAVTG
jgi:hypothetical protein